MRALVAGSILACALGAMAGTNLKLGVHPDSPGLQAAADSLSSFAAPPAEAAEPATDQAQPAAIQPVVYVKSDGRWVSAAQRDAEASDARSEATVQTQQAEGWARVADAIDAAGVNGLPAADHGPDQSGGAPIDPPPRRPTLLPPPLTVVSLSQPAASPSSTRPIP